MATVTPPCAEPTCAHGHEGVDRLAAELRALLLLALDRLDPLLARLRAAGSDDGPTAGGAAARSACPVCFALAMARGEHPERSGRVAEQAAGLVAAVRDALADDARPAAAPAGRPGRRVQHIPVEREPRAAGSAPC